jgi:hypothetical protein
MISIAGFLEILKMRRQKNCLLHSMLQCLKRITLPDAQLQAVYHLKIETMKIQYSASGHPFIQGVNSVQP